jgi:membrane protein implicated in regulation of membrane protease activity
MFGWVLVFLLLILFESFIGDFTALTISIGALAAIGVALLHMPFSIQVIGFVFVSFASLLIFRPLLQRKVTPVIQHFTADSYLGSKAEVLEKITSDRKGRIKVGGEIWFAESTHDIEAGEIVIISEIDSAIMRVVPAREVLIKEHHEHETEHTIKSDPLKNKIEKEREET